MALKRYHLLSLFWNVFFFAVSHVLLSASAHGGSFSDPSLPAAQRAQMTLEQMTEQEKLSLVHGVIAARWGGEPKPAGSIGSAGYVPGIPRLGIPALQETDAELGVANPGNVRPGDTATAMPSDLALASTWDPPIARRQGQAVGAEARAKGFNVLLGGAANLIRDPRGGRNFEYFSEDPLLTGLMAGSVIEGVQSRHIISTIKHFALNAQETDRVVLDARIDPAAMRESDLLAFEIAIERGRPGAVMCAYNQVNGSYCCENDWLLNQVLKTDWRYPFFVMSDWGAVHSTTRSAMAGLDQESGEQLDTQNFFEGSFGASDRRRRRPQGQARRHGATNSDFDLRARPRRQDRRLRACRLRCERSYGARHRARRDGSVEEPGPPAARRRYAQARRDRKLTPIAARFLGRRLFASHPPRRNRGEGTGRREPRHDLRPRFAAGGDPSVSFRTPAWTSMTDRLPREPRRRRLTPRRSFCSSTSG